MQAGQKLAEVSKEEGSPTSVLQQNPFKSIVDAPASRNGNQVGLLPAFKTHCDIAI